MDNGNSLIGTPCCYSVFTSFRLSPMPVVDLENAANTEHGNADSDSAKAEVKEHIWDSGDRIGHLGQTAPGYEMS